MIQVVLGEPGSGKTYFGVNYLLTYCDYNELYDEYILKPNVLVISNIEGLKVKHWKFPECMQERTVEEFFTIDNFEQIQKKLSKNHIIFLLDEAHDIFPTKYDDDKVKAFFAYHRHIGLDVFLFTQGITFLSRMFLPLVEFLVFAQPRSRKIGKSFLYHYKTKGGQLLYPKMLPMKKLVFNAYVSMRVDESNKPKNAVLFWATLVVFLFACAIGLFSYAVSSITSKAKTTQTGSGLPTNSVKSESIATLQALENRKASRSVPVTVPDPVPVSAPVVADSPYQWTSYRVQGVILGMGKEIYLVNGRRIGGERTRNFDQDLMTVEFYGPEISDSPAFKAPGKRESRGAVGLPPRAEPIGEATAYYFQ